MPAELPPSRGTSPVAKPFAKFWSKLKTDSILLRHYLWKYRKLMGFGLLTLILVDTLEILPPIFMKQAVDIALDHQPVNLLLRVAFAYLAVAFVQGLCRYGWRMYLIRASMLAGRDMRGSYAHHLFGLSMSFFDRRRIGDLMSVATNDVEAVRTALGAGLLTLGDALIYFATVPVAMFWLSPKLTLLAFIPLPVIPWLVMRNELEIHDRFEKVQESFGKLSAMAQESLNGVRVVKGFAKEDVLLRRFEEAGEEYLKLNMDRARVQSAFGPTLDFTMSLGLVLLLYFGGKILVFQDSAVLSIGTFVAFQRYIQKMVWPMAALGIAISSYQRAVSGSNRLQEIYSVSSDILEAPEPKLPADFSSAVSPWKTRGAVEFRDLNFAFPGTSKLVLEKISLKIAPGERVAFIGAIGSGKSALLSLLPRLYPLARGMLFVDDVDICDWPLEEIRRQVGYVGQEVFLFSESVSENVAFGLHEWRTRDTQVIENAAEASNVHDDILGLAGSYQTRLGERGVNLSGGQKQRLTIARALAKQPPILVLDDALSSVDVRTEEKILRGLRARPSRNTEIIAAHRISTIKDATRIVLLDQGKIRQMGTHEELLRERRGAYFRFYEQQRLKEDLESYADRLVLEPGVSG